MRTFSFSVLAIALLGAGACSSTPTPTEPKVVKVDITNAAEAQAAGYKIVNKNGQKLYCRKELVTGSRTRFTTECLTEEQRQAMMEGTRRQVETLRSRLPPQGH